MLNSLEVVNGSISPTFRKDVFEYDVNISDEVLSLVLDYEAPLGATVTIYGNDYLTDGENHVIIEVYEDELVTYMLNVMKESSKEVFSDLNTYAKVEVGADDNSHFNNLITPSIAIVCFLTIVTLFSIIFKKK